MRRWERKDVFNGQPYTAITTDFQGLGELADFTASVPRRLQYSDTETTDRAIRGLREGDQSKVRQAEKLLAAYEARGLLAPLTPIMRPSIVGMVPIVPAVLAGHPETMLRPDTTEAMSERSPIKIMIDCGVLCNVTNGTIEMRGIALLSLVMALQSIRPVSLTLFDTMSWAAGSGYDTSKFIMWAIDFPTNPLHLGQLAFCLTSRLMACDLPFTHTNEVLGRRAEAFGFAWRLHPTQKEYEEQCRRHWELTPQDLCFVGGALEQGIGTDPMAWVQAQIDKLKQRQV